MRTRLDCGSIRFNALLHRSGASGRIPFASCIIAVALAFSGCRTTADDQARLAAEIKTKIPLWVEIECSKRGKLKPPKRYSVLMMPDEQVQWLITSSFDGQCRIYGAIVKKTVKNADLCDIRFRSVEAIPTQGRCKCVPGRYVLEEGYPVSERCCRLHPEAVYCKQPEETPPPPD